MSDHVTAWIAAYHDGELSGAQRQKVAAHLQTCSACQAELEALQELSRRLQEAPAPTPRLSEERFVSQVRLRMGPGPALPAWQRRLRLGWWLAPAGVIGLWAFGQAVLLISGWLITFLPELDQTMRLGSLVQASAWLQVGEGLALILVLELGLTFITTILLGGWLASWWITKS